MSKTRVIVENVREANVMVLDAMRAGRIAYSVRRRWMGIGWWIVFPNE